MKWGKGPSDLALVVGCLGLAALLSFGVIALAHAASRSLARSVNQYHACRLAGRAIDVCLTQ